MLRSSLLIQCVEALWYDLQHEQPDLPDVTVIFCQDDYMYGGAHTDDKLLLITTRAVEDGARIVFDTVLHEAVHFLCHERGLKHVTEDGLFHLPMYGTVAGVFFDMKVRWGNPQDGWNMTSTKRKYRRKHKHHIKALRTALKEA